MYARKENNIIVKYLSIPKGLMIGLQYSTEKQIELGFYPLTTPTYDNTTHKLGAIKKVANKKEYTYNVIALTEKEIAGNVTKAEAEKYIQRREDGQRFSDMQGAKLVLLQAPDNVKKEISTFFAESQGFLVQGWWKSALRDLESKEPTPYVNKELLDSVIDYVHNYIEQSYV